jgi:serine/threonine protein kinase
MTIVSVRVCFYLCWFDIRSRSFLLGLVLELVEGGDLLDHIMKTGGLCNHHLYDSYLTRSNPTFLAEIDARDITYQMCNALAVRRTSLTRTTATLTSACSISTLEE